MGSNAEGPFRWFVRPFIDQSVPLLFRLSTSPSIDRSIPLLGRLSTSPSIDQSVPLLFRLSTSPSIDQCVPLLGHFSTRPSIDQAVPLLGRPLTSPYLSLINLDPSRLDVKGYNCLANCVQRTRPKACTTVSLSVITSRKDYFAREALLISWSVRPLVGS